jgi:hypothetical protein
VIFPVRVTRNKRMMNLCSENDNARFSSSSSELKLLNCTPNLSRESAEQSPCPYGLQFGCWLYASNKKCGLLICSDVSRLLSRYSIKTKLICETATSMSSDCGLFGSFSVNWKPTNMYQFVHATKNSSSSHVLEAETVNGLVNVYVSFQNNLTDLLTGES